MHDRSNIAVVTRDEGLTVAISPNSDATRTRRAEAQDALCRIPTLQPAAVLQTVIIVRRWGLDRSAENLVAKWLVL